MYALNIIKINKNWGFLNWDFILFLLFFNFSILFSHFFHYIFFHSFEKLKEKKKEKKCEQVENKKISKSIKYARTHAFSTYIPNGKNTYLILHVRMKNYIEQKGLEK